MKRAKLKVHHFVVADVVRRYGREQATADLLRVKYDHGQPPDKEYPVSLGQLDFFIRFFTSRAGKATFTIRMRHLDSDDAGKTLGRFRIAVPEDAMVLDTSFKLHQVRAPHPGHYVFELCQRTRRDWQGEPWRVVGREYIIVEAKP